MTNGFVVLAEFTVEAEDKAAFLELCRFDSVRSVTDEDGCQVFDVVTSDDEPQAVVLYEVYDDRAAFDAHQQTPHYKTFAEGWAKLKVQVKAVRFLRANGGVAAIRFDRLRSAGRKAAGQRGARRACWRRAAG